MLSYAWANKTTVLKLRDELLERGLKVWIDEENILQDIYNSMAQGVRSSHVIVPCLSAAYSRSPNCRREIKFAIDEKKKVVPVRLDHDLSDEIKLITSGLLCKYNTSLPMS